ncbi:hypothetical protein AACH06_30150, partial [Ideonella sp. DXS29W]
VLPNNLDAGQFKLHLRTANSGEAIATNGTAKVVNVANQELGYYRFAVVAGKGYGLALGDLGFTPTGTGQYLRAYVYRPDGTQISQYCDFSVSTKDCDWSPGNFSEDGTYGLVFVPKYGYSASFSAMLNKDVTGELKVDASSATEVNLNAGQNARYTFDGVAGSALQLLWTNNTL